MSISASEQVLSYIESFLDSGPNQPQCLIACEKELAKLQDPEQGEYVRKNVREIVDRYKEIIEKACHHNKNNIFAKAALEELQISIDKVTEEDAINTIERAGKAIYGYLVQRGYISDTRGEEGMSVESDLPSFNRLDRIRIELDDILDIEEIFSVLNYLSRNNHKRVTTFGRRLPQEVQAIFFEVMCKYYPSDKYYMKCYTMSSAETGDLERAESGLKKMIQHGISIWDLPGAAKVARRVGNVQLMQHITRELENNLDRPRCLSSFGAMAIKLNDKRSMKIAVWKLGAIVDEDSNIFLYAKLVKILGDKNLMYGVLEKLEGRMANEHSVRHYAEIAHALKDHRVMSKAFKLVSYLHMGNRWNVMMFAKLALHFKDVESMIRARDLLAAHLDSQNCFRYFEMLELELELHKSREGASHTGESYDYV